YLITDLFAIEVDFNSVADDMEAKDENFMPTSVMKEDLHIHKAHTKALSLRRLRGDVFYKEENEFHISQHERALFQSGKDENWKRSHYILNPKIPQLISDITNKVDMDIDFVRILT